jgi:hypothetical protein
LVIGCFPPRTELDKRKRREEEERRKRRKDKEEGREGRVPAGSTTMSLA